MNTISANITPPLSQLANDLQTISNSSSNAASRFYNPLTNRTNNNNQSNSVSEFQRRIGNSTTSSAAQRQGIGRTDDSQLSISSRLQMIERNLTHLHDTFQSEIKDVKKKLDNIQTLHDKVERLLQNHEATKENDVKKKPTLYVRTLVRTIHKLRREEEDQFDLESRFDNAQNQKITLAIIEAAKEASDHDYSLSAYRDATAKYFEGLRRKHKNQVGNIAKFTEERIQNAFRTRRKRLFDGRSKYLESDVEKRIWNQVHPILMSDEEDDGEKFKKMSLPWRSQTLTNLCRNLDERWFADPKSKRRQERVDGGISERPPPVDLKLAAFITTPTH